MNLDALAHHDFRRILDIGANVGDWTRAASKIWPRAEFLQIEANPGCGKALEKTGKPFRIALLGRRHRERVPFYTIDDTATGASIYREMTTFYDNCQPQQLEQFTLDEICHPIYDLIKIDTQGSECDILRGGPQVIASAKCLILETSQQPYNEGAPLEGEVIALARSLGFPRYLELSSFWTGICTQRDLAFLRR